MLTICDDNKLNAEPGDSLQSAPLSAFKVDGQEEKRETTYNRKQNAVVAPEESQSATKLSEFGKAVAKHSPQKKKVVDLDNIAEEEEPEEEESESDARPARWMMIKRNSFKQSLKAVSPFTSRLSELGKPDSCQNTQRKVNIDLGQIVEGDEEGEAEEEKPESVALKMFKNVRLVREITSEFGKTAAHQSPRKKHATNLSHILEEEEIEDKEEADPEATKRTGKKKATRRALIMSSIDEKDEVEELTSDDDFVLHAAELD